MSRKRYTFLLLLVALVGMTSLALVNGRSKEVSVNSIPAVPVPKYDNPRSLDPVQNIRFTIYDAGIQPRKIKVQKGLVSIVIEDRTRMSEGLAVENENGNQPIRVGLVRRSQNFWRGRDQIRLTPGTYVVFDTSKPENRSRLIVTP